MKSLVNFDSLLGVVVTIILLPLSILFFIVLLGALLVERVLTCIDSRHEDGERTRQNES